MEYIPVATGERSWGHMNRQIEGILPLIELRKEVTA